MNRFVVYWHAQGGGYRDLFRCFFIIVFFGGTFFSFYKHIEAQIWSEIFTKTIKNLKYDYGNFSNESLGQVKLFKHVSGVGVG